jgi:hypothetical protein
LTGNYLVTNELHNSRVQSFRFSIGHEPTEPERTDLSQTRVAGRLRGGP